MPVEIEAKMKVKDLAAVRDRLSSSGGNRMGSAMESNTFLDTKDHSLLTRDQGLRVRTTTQLEKGEGASVVTFKGPRQQGVLKSRDEREVQVHDPQAMMSVFEGLGFTRVLTFEKRRESWELDGCEVELDELPHLGVFVEIEGPSEQRVLALREKLGLSNQPLIKASYIALLMAHLQELGSHERVVAFPQKSASPDSFRKL